MIRLAVALSLSLSVGAGCTPFTVAARPLADLEVHTPGRLANPPRARIAVTPFVEARGDTWSRTSPTVVVPFVNWFHQAGSIDYPDNVGVLHGSERGREFSATGALDHAFQIFLARAMCQMGLGSVTAAPDGAGADYVVTGRLVRTRYSTSIAPIAGILLGPFGVPFFSTRFELEYQVTLADARTGAPLCTRDYRFRDRTIGGIYYGQNRLKQFQRGLDATLPAAVRDLDACLPPSLHAANAALTNGG
jgi:hypothetical protein